MVGITGTPGTGKKSVAKIVAGRLGLATIGINELARSNNLEDVDTGEVDTRKLRSLLTRGLPKSGLVYGHLLPYVLTRRSLSRVVVLRCDPTVLKERLKARGYPRLQVVENLEAELIGIVSADAFDAYGEALATEFDTTRTSPAEAAKKVVELLAAPKMHARRIDWTLDYDSGAKLRLLLSTVD